MIINCFFASSADDTDKTRTHKAGTAPKRTAVMLLAIISQSLNLPLQAVSSKCCIEVALFCAVLSVNATVPEKLHLLR